MIRAGRGLCSWLALGLSLRPSQAARPARLRGLSAFSAGSPQAVPGFGIAIQTCTPGAKGTATCLSGVNQQPDERVDVAEVRQTVSVDICVEDIAVRELSRVASRVGQCQYERIDVAKVDGVVAVQVAA